MDEYELIEKSKQGNKSALNILLNNNYGVLKGYVIKLTGDAHLSQDIIQDTLLKAVLNIKKFEPKAKFSTWLIRIANNTYIDYIRKNKSIELIDESIESKIPGPEDQTIINWEYKKILIILNSIPYEKKSVFILKHYYGYKYDEIASILNIPIGTVRSRLHNCIKQIISQLEKRS